MHAQMPVTEGPEATRLIRMSGISNPFIGLSANVYKKDIERCKEAGMTDHVGKSFSKASLYSCLQRYLLKDPVHS